MGNSHVREADDTVTQNLPCTTNTIERAKEALGYDPRDNSAEWNGDELRSGER